MKEGKNKQVKGIYRTKKYGTWQPFSIVVPDEITDLKTYCTEDIMSLGITVKELQIKQTIKT